MNEVNSEQTYMCAKRRKYIHNHCWNGVSYSFSHSRTLTLLSNTSTFIPRKSFVCTIDVSMPCHFHYFLLLHFSGFRIYLWNKFIIFFVNRNFNLMLLFLTLQITMEFFFCTLLSNNWNVSKKIQPKIEFYRFIIACVLLIRMLLMIFPERRYKFCILHSNM